jgi:hypothetical protein
MPYKQVSHSLSLSDPVLYLVTQANLIVFLIVHWTLIKETKRKRLNAMPALLKFWCCWYSFFLQVMQMHSQA